MRAQAWARLAPPEHPASRDWLSDLLGRNARCHYLRRYGSPLTREAFRERVPVVAYDDLRPWLARVEGGEGDVLFAGRPVAYELTSGSSGAVKRIPYSAEGLVDFRNAVVPWLAGLVRRHGITGSAYLSISPATREPGSIGGVPVGLPDAAYLGEVAGGVLAEVAAVPPEVGAIADVRRWREITVHHLRRARDLEFISVWSPTFLLRLLDDLPDAREIWPGLRLVSCWASGASAPFAARLAARLPHARFQPKGLLSTEAAVTLPDALDRPALNPHGFFEFELGGELRLADELREGETYAVTATTASGLYRYRTGDLVRCEGRSATGATVLEFVGRDLVSDLVGEKLTEPFVESCLAQVAGFRLLMPNAEGDGYLLAAEAGRRIDIRRVERRLCANPQYAYARRIGQLKPLALRLVDGLFDNYSRLQVRRQVRLGDVKPQALRAERGLAALLELAQ